MKSKTAQMNNKNYDFLIVGSGLFGATFAYLAKQKGKKCLVIEKRSHLGGNVYSEDISGIDVHKYGAHIFHTSNKTVWDFVNNIVPFNRYTNSPVAIAPNGKAYNLPFNMNTFYQLWGVKTPQEATAKLEQQRAEAVEKIKSEGATEPRNLEEQALTLVGKDIYELLIKGYTEKQWGRRCCDLPAFIIKRLPVRLTYDNNYFNDNYQGIPTGGYTLLINRLLEGIDCKTDTDFFANRKEFESIAEKVVFTGRIDEFYDFQFGKLEYRTVGFETELLDNPNYQGNAVVNYTSGDVPYTRIIEHKHFQMFGNAVYDNPKTVISKEYPMEWNESLEPFYPINDERNQSLYAEYKALADKETNVVFGGRLAEYKYYDMAPVIEQAMIKAAQILG